jgi:hypothetical protein
VAKGKKPNRWEDIDGGSAFVIPLTLLHHPNFARLSPHGHKLIMDLARQYTGFNNGYLCASFSLLEDKGWASETLWRSTRECEHYGLLQRTQQGGRNKPNLHAFTWRRIDYKKDRPPLDVVSSTKPSDLWKKEREPFDLKVVHTRKRASKVSKVKLRRAA